MSTEPFEFNTSRWDPKFSSLNLLYFSGLFHRRTWQYNPPSPQTWGSARILLVAWCYTSHPPAGPPPPGLLTHPAHARPLTQPWLSPSRHAPPSEILLFFLHSLAALWHVPCLDASLGCKLPEARSLVCLIRPCMMPGAWSSWSLRESSIKTCRMRERLNFALLTPLKLISRRPRNIEDESIGFWDRQFQVWRWALPRAVTLGEVT